MSNKPQKVEHLSDWLAYYQITIDDIKFAKRQQWYLCYYALLIFGAIIGLTQIKNLGLRNYSLIINLGAIIVAIVVSYFLIRFQIDLYRYRNDMNQIIEKAFPSELEEIIAYAPASRRRYYIGFLVFLITVVWAGCVAVLFVLRTL